MSILNNNDSYSLRVSGGKTFVSFVFAAMPPKAFAKQRLGKKHAGKHDHQKVFGKPPEQAYECAPLPFKEMPSMVSGVFNVSGVFVCKYYDPPANFSDMCKKVPSLHFDKDTGIMYCGVCKAACAAGVIPTSKWATGINMCLKKWSDVLAIAVHLYFVMFV